MNFADSAQYSQRRTQSEMDDEHAYKAAAAQLAPASTSKPKGYSITGDNWKDLDRHQLGSHHHPSYLHCRWKRHCHCLRFWSH